MLTIIYTDAQGQPQRHEGKSLFADETGLFLDEDGPDMKHIKPADISGGVNVAIVTPEPKPKAPHGALELMRVMTRLVKRPYMNRNAALWLVLCLVLGATCLVNASQATGQRPEVRGQRSEVSNVQDLAWNYIPTAGIVSENEEPRTKNQEPEWLILCIGALSCIAGVVVFLQWFRAEQEDQLLWERLMGDEDAQHIVDRRVFVHRSKPKILHGDDLRVLQANLHKEPKPHVQPVLQSPPQEPLKFSLGSW